MRHAALLAAFLLLAAAPAHAFDLENVELDTVLERAKAEKKLVFLDFYLPG